MSRVFTIKCAVVSGLLLLAQGAHAQTTPNIPPGPGVVPGTTDPVPPDAHVDNSTEAEASKALTAAGWTNLKMLQKGYTSVWNYEGTSPTGQHMFVGWSRARGVFPMQQ